MISPAGLGPGHASQPAVRRPFTAHRQSGEGRLLN